VRLEKPGAHLLNALGAAPTAADIGRSVRIARAATLLALGSLAVAPAAAGPVRRLVADAS
jgi:cobalamin biosynthesis protein CobD/CbiB